MGMTLPMVVPPIRYRMYADYDGMNARMQLLAQRFNGMVTIEQLTNATWEGRNIAVIRVHNKQGGVTNPMQVADLKPSDQQSLRFSL